PAPTERQLDAASCPVGVNEHLTRVDRAHEAVCSADVARPDARHERVARPVRERDGLVLVREGRDREYRPEDLLLRDRRLGRDVVEQRRLEEEAAREAGVVRWSAADNELPLLASLLHERRDA